MIALVFGVYVNTLTLYTMKDINGSCFLWFTGRRAAVGSIQGHSCAAVRAEINRQLKDFNDDTAKD